MDRDRAVAHHRIGGVGAAVAGLRSGIGADLSDRHPARVPVGLSRRLRTTDPADAVDDVRDNFRRAMLGARLARPPSGGRSMPSSMTPWSERSSICAAGPPRRPDNRRRPWRQGWRWPPKRAERGSAPPPSAR